MKRITSPILSQLHRLADTAADLPDRVLLERFCSGDGEAFTRLVERHGPMVLGVCRRLLGEACADDAFQATFLTLARRAEKLSCPDSLAGWLHTVSRNIALKARRSEQRRRLRETRRPASVTASAADDLSARELLSVLDEEVQRLPDAERLPLLLCFWQGLTQEEAAARLGWSPGSVKGRLERGRQCLAKRLARRGYAAQALLLAPLAAAAVPGDLLAAAGQLPLGRAPAAVAALAGAATAPAWRWGVAALLLIGAGLIGLGLSFSRRSPAEPPPAEKPAELSPRVVTDRFGDPLPEGAVARLGTIRFRHSNWINAVAFTPDGKHLVSASWDHTIRLWDRATGKELRRFTGHTYAVMCIAVSADGKTLASGGAGGGDGTARVWDIATGRELFNVRAHQGSTVSGVVLSSDGKTLATVGGGNGHRTLVLWDVASGKELRVLGDKNQNVTTCVAFSPDGKELASGGWDQSVQLWNVSTGERIRQLKGHGRGVSSLTFSTDGKKLFSGSHDDTIRLWDTATGRELLQLQGQGGANQDPGGPGMGAEHKGGVNSIALSPDGKVLASGGYNGTVRLWDVATSKEIVKLQALSREVRALAFAPDGEALATVGYEHAIHLWDPSTGKRLSQPAGHDAEVHVVTFSPDGRRVASVSHDHSVRLWDRVTGQEVHVLRGHAAFINCAAFSPDGRTLASGDWHGVIRLWDVATGKELRDLVGHEGYVMSLDYSPDGKLLASASSGSGGNESSVRLWDPVTGKALRTLKEHSRQDTRLLQRLLSAEWQGPCREDF